MTKKKAAMKAAHFSAKPGAGGETRTRTLSPAADFESAASTNSATPALIRGRYST